jgi:predicted O-methyltransferase YrrM
MSTLHSSRVQQVLERLYRDAAKNDRQIDAEEQQAIANAREGVLSEEALSSLRDRAFMAVAPEVGRLLYTLVRARRPLLIVEMGTSFGLSGIHLASALVDNEHGRLVTAEQSAAKAEQATRHFEEAGIARVIEVRQGDAFETLRDVQDVDMLVLDGWKPLYLPLLKQLEPVLARNCLVVADDVTSMSEQLAPYLSYVRDPRNGFVSSEIPLDDGVEISVR